MTSIVFNGVESPYPYRKAHIDHIAIAVPKGKLEAAVTLFECLSFQEYMHQRKTRPNGTTYEARLYLPMQVTTSVQLSEVDAVPRTIRENHVAIAVYQPAKVIAEIRTWTMQNLIQPIELEQVDGGKWHVFIPDIGIRLELVPFS